MIAALYKAFAQLPDPRLRRVLLFGIGAALAAYVTLVAVAWMALAHSDWFATAWVERSSHVLVGLMALVLPLPFFPALATLAMSFRLEAVAEAVEQRHYPGRSPPRAQPWTEILAVTLRFLVATLIINLLALPIYGLLLFTGLSILLDLVVNGYLLGREYFELAALRRMPPDQARLHFRNRLGRWWLAGALITLIFKIPLLNLAAPVIAAAFMLHCVEALPPRSEGA